MAKKQKTRQRPPRQQKPAVPVRRAPPDRRSMPAASDKFAAQMKKLMGGYG